MTEVVLTGYQGETIEQFIHKLRKQRVRAIIDVREIPLSRKNGFSKKRLSKILEDNGIEYHHFEQLGSPSELRQSLREKGDYIDFFTRYRKHAKQHGGTLKNVLKIINSKHSALMCFEKDCELCHRTIVASELERIAHHQLRVIPI